MRQGLPLEVVVETVQELQQDFLGVCCETCAMMVNTIGWVFSLFSLLLCLRTFVSDVPH